MCGALCVFLEIFVGIHSCKKCALERTIVNSSPNFEVSLHAFLLNTLRYTRTPLMSTVKGSVAEPGPPATTLKLASLLLASGTFLRIAFYTRPVSVEF